MLFFGRKQKNASDIYDGIFNVFTGADDVSKVAVMDMWNGLRQTKYVSLYRHLIGLVDNISFWLFEQVWRTMRDGERIIWERVATRT